jgi:para-nitrobenzyl esterase
MVVETPSGRIAGRLVDTTLTAGPDGAPIHEFIGIRYAQAPVGPLRLRPPVAAPPWSGVLEAVTQPDRSIQPATMLAPPGEPESEDCLALNVWTPDPAASLPVMVWIHGGSFTTGSGSLSWYDGARLASRGVVVVTVNYRLGALGFLHLEAIGGDAWAGSANLGLLDQTLALEWVRDHIGAFGGDASRVTLFGESAGAMSVSAHLGLPASDGLFHRAVAQSGAARHVQSAESGARTAAKVLDVLGIGAAHLDRLADVPAGAFRDLVETINATDTDRDLPLPFRPTIDGTTLPVAPIEAIRGGASAGIALLTGTTRDEMNLFRLVALLAGASPDLDDERLARRMGRALAARGIAVEPADAIAAYRRHIPEATNADLWSAIGTDTTFRMPMIEMLDAHVGAGGQAWSYLFTHPSTGLGGGLGAAHAIEIPFVFDNLHQKGAAMLLGEVTAERRLFAADLADRWAAFARAEPLTVPGRDTEWPPYEPDRRSQVVCDLRSAVIERHQDDLRTLWSADPVESAGATGR